VLEYLEATSGEAGEEGVLAALAFLAAQDVALDEDELNAARRRALFVLSAGGDPHRALDADARPVRGLADDLDDPERRAELAASLDRLGADADGLAGVTRALDRLRADSDLAWRQVALSLLAAEIASEGEG
jgi:hypothetical protein